MWHIGWARSPAALGGCADPCGSHEAAVTVGTSESDTGQNKDGARAVKHQQTEVTNQWQQKASCCFSSHYQDT